MSARGRALIALAFAAAQGSALGCAGTEVGNPVESVPLSLSARSSNGDIVLGKASEADAGMPAIAIDELWVSLGDMRFVLDDDCRAQRERAAVEGPIVAELTREPALLEAMLPSSSYCSLRVSLERASEASLVGEDAGAPGELADYSLLIRGHRRDGVAFRIRSRDKTDLMLHSSKPFELNGPDSPLILAFDAGVWLDGVDLASAEPNADGEVLLEPGQEAALLRAFEANLRRSLFLYKDSNKDGDLDDGEADEPLAM